LGLRARSSGRGRKAGSWKSERFRKPPLKIECKELETTESRLVAWEVDIVLCTVVKVEERLLQLDLS
jgi:hypothetical protein